MTESELNRLHWITKEIGLLLSQKRDLQTQSLIKSQELSDMPRGGGISDKVAQRAIAIQEINELYDIKLKELYLTRAKIERYINTIEDPEIRLIIRLRCINNLAWEEIAAETMILDDKGNVIRQRSRTAVYRKFKNFLENN